VDSNLPLTIGYEAWGGLHSKPKESGVYQGLMDEVKLWSRVLTAAEIRAEFEHFRAAAAADSQQRAAAAKQRAEAMKKVGTALDFSRGINWQPVAVESFAADRFTSRWEMLRGDWKIKNGVLRCAAPSFLALAARMKAPVRIEYDARSEDPSDLTSFWGTHDAAYKGGYFIGFASDGNSRNKLLRFGREAASSEQPLATPGKWHHVIAQVFGNRVQLIVDGKIALDYTDPRPVHQADTIGLIGWGEAEFDNIRVFRETK
jgi:hypothetical protein